MKIRTPQYYKNFKCIAGACTDTCCSGWQVDVDDRSYAYYKTVGGSFGERLRSVMIDGKKGQEGQFKICPDGRCPFLNENNLCDLYANLGEDALCVTCDQYPRYTTEYGNLREVGIALSCKTAAQLILEKEGIPAYDEYEDEDAFFSLNNIDGDLFINLLPAREKAIEIIHNREYHITDRMIILLEFGYRLQRACKTPNTFGRIIKDIDRDFAGIVKDVKAFKDSDVISGCRKIWKCYMGQVIIKKEWPVLAAAAEERLYSDSGYRMREKQFYKINEGSMYEYENILTYFIYRYFLKGSMDKDILTKVKMAVVSTFMIIESNMAFMYGNNMVLNKEHRIDNAHIYSREVEHSEENFDRLCRLFCKKKVFGTENLKKIIKKL